jgi:hypothetical protein
MRTASVFCGNVRHNRIALVQKQIAVACCRDGLLRVYRCEPVALPLVPHGHQLHGHVQLRADPEHLIDRAAKRSTLIDARSTQHLLHEKPSKLTSACHWMRLCVCGRRTPGGVPCTRGMSGGRTARSYPEARRQGKGHWWVPPSWRAAADRRRGRRAGLCAPRGPHRDLVR